MDLFTACTNVGYTENGAFTYTSSLDKCLDLFAQGGALRENPERIIPLVDASAKEDLATTLKILLYLRDIRSGQGEKRVYQDAIKYLKDKINIDPMIDATIEYGSWKDVFKIFTLEEYGPYVKREYEKHIKEDKYSLMEKWMPSIGGSSNKQAEALAKYLGLTPRNYRKYLSKARASIDITEVKMCSNRWNEINYEHTPSRTMLFNRKAFINHDNDRFREYLSKVSKGEAKINTGTLYPYDIIERVLGRVGYESRYGYEVDETLENLWKNLKDYKCEGNSIVVADTSGSMIGRPMGVALSLAFYFAERNKGQFANKFITFSSHPEFFEITGDTLHEKVRRATGASWGMNTDLQALFDLILQATIRFNVPEEERFDRIFIVSDMEFDCCGPTTTNFELIKKKYADAGIKLPELIFWNVNARSGSTPVTMDESGTALVSGCSPSIFESVIGEDFNPISIMHEVIDRYDVSNLIKE